MWGGVVEWGEMTKMFFQPPKTVKILRFLLVCGKNFFASGSQGATCTGYSRKGRNMDCPPYDVWENLVFCVCVKERVNR